ncbi:MAG: hypothetical protein K1X94_33785 [Sandaracinaceae bacterium]|nr:hypothetical protein [Sandaracinaceae bacterium]
MRPLVLTLVTAGLVLAAPLAASADVVESPPASCPTGSTPSTGHSGPYCAPTESCAVGGVCPNGASCVPLRQCIETRPCGGWTPPDAALCTIQNVIGPCASDGTCAVGVCTERNVCPGPGSSSGGCGCRVGHPTPTHAGLAALAVLGLLAARRARRSR